MWWNETARRWERHPQCQCGHSMKEPCVCLNLPPLDAQGKPLTEHGALGPNYGPQRTPAKKADAA